MVVVVVVINEKCFRSREEGRKKKGEDLFVSVVDDLSGIGSARAVVGRVPQSDDVRLASRGCAW